MRVAASVLTCALVPGLAAAERLAIRTYSSADGLPRDTVLRIVPDSIGYLWLCTPEGLSRFDGQEFVNYGTADGLPHAYVNDLLETRDGTIWVATEGGLARYEPVGPQRFVPFATAGGHVNGIAESPAGTLWVGSDRGLYRFERGTLEPVAFDPPADPSDPLVDALVAGPRGELWVLAGGGSALVRRSADGRFETIPDLGNGLRRMIVDRAERVWVSTTTGVLRLTPTSVERRRFDVRRFTTADGLPGGWIYAVHEAADGHLWVGGDRGLAMLEAGPVERFRSYGTAHGLSDEQVRCIEDDRDGNLWVGSRSTGAMRIETRGFTSHLVGSQARHFVGAIVEDRAGQLVVAQGQTQGLGVAVFDGRDFRAFPVRLPPSIRYMGWSSGQVHFQDRAGSWWIATGQGACRYPPVARTQEFAGLLPAQVYSKRNGLRGEDVFRLYEDRRGDVWISFVGTAEERLVRWERATGRLHRYEDDRGEPLKWTPTAFAEDAVGTLWLGLYEGGLARLAAGVFQRFEPGRGLPDGLVNALLFDRRGRLWVAARGGLARLDAPAEATPQVATYATTRGLSSDDVTCVVDDGLGRIYAGTRRGVDRIDPDTGHVHHFTTADGLANNNVSVAFRDRNGGLWFGTHQGVSHLVPRPDPPLDVPPVLISAIRVAGEPIPLSDRGTAHVPEVVIGPGRRQVQVEYRAVSFRPGEVLRYQTRLEGLDDDWSSAVRELRVQYASLPAGRYRLAVRAVSSEDRPSASATAALYVLPPLWRRPWFAGIALASLAAGLVAAHRLRVARALAIERVRTRIATDLHDDVGSGLSLVAILSEVVQRRLDGKDGEAQSALERIARVSRELVDGMSDIVWAINPERDRLASLSQRMRRFATELTRARGIELSFRTLADGEDRALEADDRRQVYLVFKEALNNAVRHADCRRIEVELRVEGSQLVLGVTDDGRGRAVEGEGQGLAAMRRRAEALGGRLELSSSEGAGTRIVLRVPLLHRWGGPRTRRLA